MRGKVHGENGCSRGGQLYYSVQRGVLQAFFTAGARTGRQAGVLAEPASEAADVGAC
jgi:hypothetical protein